MCLQLPPYSLSLNQQFDVICFMTSLLSLLTSSLLPIFIEKKSIFPDKKLMMATLKKSGKGEVVEKKSNCFESIKTWRNMNILIAEK